MFYLKGIIMEYQRIKCGQGPEDMDLERNSKHHRLIINCIKRKLVFRSNGGIWGYEIGEGQAFKFSIKDYNKKILPHGMSIVNHADYSELFIICHKNEEKILKFRIEDHSLQFLKAWKSERFVVLNDLFVTPDGRMYITDPGKLSLKKKEGRVHLIRPDGSHEILLDAVYYPNGILVKDQTMYLVAMYEEAIYSFDIQADGRIDNKWRKQIFCLKGGDNLSLFENQLLVANHPERNKFLLHGTINAFNSPSSVYAINLDTGAHRQIFKDNGKEISGSSTGIRIGNDLYISQIFKDYILKVALE